jgi:uncharacterized protein YceH (UPF0502 family)
MGTRDWRLMVLSPEEARVLACLIEKQATVPDSYPLTLNSLRLACNQSTARDPIVAYDDRTVENALMSLKSMGLVRFVHPSHGGRTIRYRHVADERWHLSLAELGVLSVLVLRGPQTVGEVRTRSERQLAGDEEANVEEILDTLAARSPEPFAVHLERRPGERDARWAHLLSGAAAAQLDAVALPRDVQASAEVEATTPPPAVSPDLARDVAELWLRVERIERKLGLAEDLNTPSPSPSREL